MLNDKPFLSLEKVDQKKLLENTSYYLENHLNPNRQWDKRICPKQRISQIRYADVNWKTVADYIKAMDYHEFLKTPYWKAIASHTKYRARFRCQLCNSPHGLVTHHRDYSIHGFEHANMHELTVICYICHNKHHEIVEAQASDPNYSKKIIFIISFLIIICFLWV